MDEEINSLKKENAALKAEVEQLILFNELLNEATSKYSTAVSKLMEYLSQD